jgi:hypothetical protein
MSEQVNVESIKHLEDAYNSFKSELHEIRNIITPKPFFERNIKWIITSILLIGVAWGTTTAVLNHGNNEIEMMKKDVKALELKINKLDVLESKIDELIRQLQSVNSKFQEYDKNLLDIYKRK